MDRLDDYRQQIDTLVKEYADLKFRATEFEPGRTNVPVSGKVLDHVELQTIVQSALDGWLTTGKYNDQFEAELAKYVGVKHVLM